MNSKSLIVSSEVFREHGVWGTIRLISWYTCMKHLHSYLCTISIIGLGNMDLQYAYHDTLGKYHVWVVYLRYHPALISRVTLSSDVLYIHLAHIYMCSLILYIPLSALSVHACPKFVQCTVVYV